LKITENKYQKTSEALAKKAQSVLNISQKWVNGVISRRKCSPSSNQATGKHKSPTSFNLSQTETEKLASLWKEAKENLNELSNKKDSNIELTTQKRGECKSILKPSHLKNQGFSPQESEQIEFNVYDFTRQKDSLPAQEINNTRDTAEFGEKEEDEGKKVQLITQQEEVQEKEEVKGMYFWLIR
jgi:hypothetical protein